jgi:hypothetical protein
MHELNGQSKKAIKSFTEMYKAGVKDPTQAKFAMEEASIDANIDYQATTTNSELKTTLNSFKTQYRLIFAQIFNPNFRKADNSFHKAYTKLYPKTHAIRDIILAERNMP